LTYEFQFTAKGIFIPKNLKIGEIVLKISIIFKIDLLIFFFLRKLKFIRDARDIQVEVEMSIF